VLDSRALTKIQSIILIAVIIVAALGGGAVYVLLIGQEQTSGTIKIGFLDDLDGVFGRPVYQGAILAVEEINAEGGILGRQVELIGEDDDGGQDAVIISNALNRLISQDKVDFVVGNAAGQIGFQVQEIIAEHKILFISGGTGPEAVT